MMLPAGRWPRASLHARVVMILTGPRSSEPGDQFIGMARFAIVRLCSGLIVCGRNSCGLHGENGAAAVRVGGNVRSGVTLRKTQVDHIESASPSRADMERPEAEVRDGAKCGHPDTSECHLRCLICLVSWTARRFSGTIFK